MALGPKMAYFGPLERGPEGPFWGVPPKRAIWPPRISVGGIFKVITLKILSFSHLG